MNPCVHNKRRKTFPDHKANIFWAIKKSPVHKLPHCFPLFECWRVLHEKKHNTCTMVHDGMILCNFFNYCGYLIFFHVNQEQNLTIFILVFLLASHPEICRSISPGCLSFCWTFANFSNLFWHTLKIARMNLNIVKYELCFSETSI